MFELSKEFVNQYRNRPVTFGWQGVGALTFYRTYSRDDNPAVLARGGGTEEWVDVVERCINGMYTLLREKAKTWDEDKAQAEAREAFDTLFNIKWTPPGRGLTHMGTPFVHERGVYEALQNCGFITTRNLEENRGHVFNWFMERLMLGVGVGFDTRGAGLRVHVPNADVTSIFEVPDTREGWAKSLEILVNSFLIPGSPTIVMDYTRVRPAGDLIRGFGGVASGPEPLQQLHENVGRVLFDAATQSGTLTSRHITDIFNLIGVCVIAGNVRRSAEIALGFPWDEDYLSLKDFSNPRNNMRLGREGGWGWTSNNSILAYANMNYENVARLTHQFGEPGYLWLENVHNFGRMNGQPLPGDEDALGVNPCGEQPLHDRELCTLVEVYLPHIKDKAEFKRVLKFAYLYGKAVTSASDSITDPISREAMMRNRRIGVSLTGITQFVSANGLDTYVDWMDTGYGWLREYDRVYSNWLSLPESVRLTTIKPSGSTGLIGGVTPGIHYSVSGRYHIRRVTLSENSPLVDMVLRSGVSVVPLIGKPGSVVAEFPVDAGAGTIAERDVQPEQHLELAYLTAENWSDNSVSITVKFDQNKSTPQDMARWIQNSESRLKAVSFLALDTGVYEQMPYEEITQEKYEQLAARRTPLVIDTSRSLRELSDLYCGTDACEIVKE